jgi:bifunctional UDP-N-acetylglucosamine pyrophosphorylase/glucosamine-1-phosphate N-acetyltransferase
MDFNVKDYIFCFEPLDKISEYINSSADSPILTILKNFFDPAVKNLTQLREMNKKTQEKIIEYHENNGVQFVSLDGVGISPFAEIEQGTVVYQGTIIRGKSKIGKNTILGPNTIIENSIVGENCVINSTQIESSTLENNVTTGPFCHIRPSCVIKNGVHLGNFVEVKNSTVGENTKAGHLTYIGDSDVGKDVNFGCGSITANYDGVKKARCNIGDRAFIGSNVNLVAVPNGIKVGEDGYIAAGSTITKDVPAGALAVSRARELKIIDGWAIRHMGKKHGGK